MGNWRTVNITGTMTAADAATLLDRLDHGPDYDRDVPEGAWCLSFSRARPSLCGIGAWPAERVSACGNLAERDYDVDDVRAAFEALLPLAPSMLLAVHCGGDYESDECAATILVGEGMAVIRPPQVASVSAPSQEQMLGNLMANLLRPA